MQSVQMTRRSQSMLVAAVAVMSFAAAASAQDRTYTGANNGLWSVPGNWTPNDVPDTVAENARILSGVLVNLDNTFTIGALTVGSSNTLNFQNTADLVLNANVSNSGLITLSGINSATEFRLGSSLTLSGSGELRINNTSNSGTNVNVIGASSSASGFTLTNASGHTIHAIGDGNLGRATTGISNAGLIVADTATGNLIVNSSSSNITNTGTVRASNSGTLTLLNSVVTNTSGTIEGITSGTVALSGADITGGTLAGTIRVDADSIVRTLTNTGSVNLINTADLSTTGTITNSNLITLSGTNSATELRLIGNTTFAGAGEVRISNASTSGTNVNVIGASSSASGFSLTNGTNHTIRAIGAGNLGRSTTSLANSGLVVADGATGNLIVATTGTTNTGTIRATNNATLTLSGSTLNNSGGTVEGVSGGTIALDGVDITGGTLAGTLRDDGVATIRNLTNTGTISQVNTADLQTAGTITNNNRIQLNGINSATELRLIASTTFAGSGEVLLSATSVSGVNVNLVGASSSASGFTLTNDTNHTIRALGDANLGRDTTAIINNGLILADNPTGTFLIDANNGLTNNGTIRAQNNGTAGSLSIVGTAITNNALITTTATGRLGLDGDAQVSGGTLAGNIFTTNTNRYTSLTHSASTILSNISDLELAGTINNTGIITLNGINSATELRLVANTTLTGAGSVEIANTSNSGVNVNVIGASSSASGFSLTNAAAHTIRALGDGNLGRDTTTLFNAGTINSSGTTGNLLIDVTGALSTNTGRIASLTGGVTTFAAGTITNTNGSIGTDANAASLVRYDSGSVIVGGTLDGRAEIIGDAPTFNGLTTAATVNIINTADLQLQNTITNNGIIALSGINSSTELRLISNVTLAGTGEVRLNATSNTGSSVNVIGANSSASGFSLTNGVNHTIRALGTGNLGRDTTAIVNNGAIVSDAQDAATGFIFVVDPSGTLINNGVLRATGNGDLALFNGTYTNNGTIEALATSGVTVASSGFVLTNYNATASSLTGGTYRAINGNLLLDANNTIDLAVNSATLELSGDNNATNLFASSNAGGRSNSNAFRSNTGTFLLNDGAELVTTLASGGFSNSGDLLVGVNASFTVQGAGGGVLSNTARLRGEGTIVATSVTNSGIIAPGLAASGPLVPDAGLLTLLAPLSLSNASQLLIELGGTTSGSTFDVLSVNSVSLDGQLVVSLFNGFMPSSTDTFTVVDSAITSLTGTFAGVANGSMQTTADGSYTYTVNYTGGDVVLSNFTAVPEPTSLMLLGSAGLLLKRRRR